MQPPPPPPPPRQPRSSPPANPLPFGYDFRPATDMHYLPSLPQGSLPGTLLDNLESRGLDTFIETIGSPQHHDASFFDGAMASVEGGDLTGLGEGDLPPHFFGATSSLPQMHSTTSSSDDPFGTAHGRDYPHLNVSSLSYPPSMSGEDMSAVSALMQGSRAPSFTQRDDPYAHPFAPSAHNRLSSYSTPINSETPFPRHATGHLSQYDSGRPRPSADTGNQAAPGQLPYLSYQPPYQQPSSEANRSGMPSNLHWGSDQSFYRGGYVAPAHQETEEEVTQEMMQKMECLVPQRSANNTQPSSPGVVDENDRQQKKRALLPKPAKPQEAKVKKEVAEGERAAPQKRRVGRGSLAQDPSDDEASSDHRQASKKRRSISAAQTPRPGKRAASRSQEPTPSRRRKSQSASEAKISRENLTEDQKKANHIQSEQKRRNLIKQGFEDLHELVPSLRGSGNTSRSLILGHAAQWLDEFLEGNRQLQRILASLKPEDEGSEDDEAGEPSHEQSASREGGEAREQGPEASDDGQEDAEEEQQSEANDSEESEEQLPWQEAEQSEDGGQN